MTRPAVFAARLVMGVALLVATGTAAQCQADARPDRVDSPATTPAVAPANLEMVAFDPPSISADEQRKVLDDAARRAWRYIANNYSRESGLVNSLATWTYVTIWDISSALAAYYSARGLGLIGDDEYRTKMNRALATLESAALYQNVGFNKQYDARSGVMVDREQKKSAEGYGWSALDMGRFLVWMKIIADNDPAAREQIQRIVARLDLDRMVVDGYLRGGTITPESKSHFEYQEGRVAYEQYAAQGFALWGAAPTKALDFEANARPITVLGHEILDDRRGGANLTSEPYLMMGLELGWPTPRWEQQARNTLAAQRERFNRTKLVTMVSEDAVPVKPAFFYYYVLHRDGKDFAVRAASGGVSPSYPRWVSTKAAFGWHALFPSDYTWRAVQHVQPAGASNRGWTAGVWERSRRAVPSQNLNTSAMVLEAAYYARRNCPLIKPTCAG